MKSIWDYNVNINKKFNELNGDLSTEVCIIGGGIAGVSIGYSLLKSNLNFVLLEKDTICSKTTNCSSAKITCQHGVVYDELINKYGIEFAKLYLEANYEGVKNIKEIIEKEKIECDLKLEPSFVFTQRKADVEVLKREYEAIKKLAFKEVEYLDDIDIGLKACGAIKFKNQASFNPVKYTLALANIIYKKNMNIYENATVTKIDNTKEGFKVYANDKVITAKYVVLATHFPIKDIPGFYFIKMYQDTSYIVAVDIGDNEFKGTYINYEDPTISLRSVEKDGKNILLVGGNNNKTGDPDTQNKYDSLIQIAESLYPECKIICKWNTQDCVTIDKVPYIGRFSKLEPNILVATGFNKWGMSTSNVAANIITDIITGKKNKYEKVFRATRYNLIKNIQPVCYIANQTVQSLVINKFKVKEENINDIPNGTGKVIKINGKNVGIYKDKEGVIYKINPYCSHLKCLLTFNNLDKTWDCPCHGSRFDIFGQVINSPASKNLNDKEK